MHNFLWGPRAQRKHSKLAIVHMPPRIRSVAPQSAREITWPRGPSAFDQLCSALISSRSTMKGVLDIIRNGLFLIRSRSWRSPTVPRSFATTTGRTPVGLSSLQREYKTPGKRILYQLDQYKILGGFIADHIDKFSAAKWQKDGGRRQTLDYRPNLCSLPLILKLARQYGRWILKRAYARTSG